MNMHSKERLYYRDDNNDGFNQQKNRKKKAVSDHYKIPTKQINLNTPYDLPCKDFEFTKKRKYKQNLNPIFQMLSTTNYRYQSFANIPEKESIFNRENAKDNIQKDQTEQRLKDKSSSFDNKLLQGKNSSIFSFGDALYSSFEQQKNRKDNGVNNNKKYIDQKVKSREKSNLTLDLPLSRFSNGKQQHQQCSQEKVLSSQVAHEYLIDTINKTRDISGQIEESNEKLQMLREKIKMLKEKNLLKDRQISLIEKQKQKQQEKSRVIEKQLQNRSQKYKAYQEQHHKIYNRLKTAKQQLIKQERWLQQQKGGIEKVRQKLQQLLMKMRILEQQQDKREQYLSRMIEQQQIKRKMQDQLDEINPRVVALRQELTLVEEQTQTLQMHQSQLLNLELKFKKQTQKLQQQLNHLMNQFDQKNNFISQQQEIDQMTKDLELQIGEMNQGKIIMEQHIKEIHLKISMKNRNIKHIQSVQEKKYEIKQQRSIYPSSMCRRPKESKHLLPKDNTNNDDPIFPLPTIRQQSNNTSVYQTPRNQQLLNPPQQQSSYHPFSSKQLQIDLRMFSRAEELLANTNKQRCKKKYFVIESEEDAASNKKPFYCFKKNADYFIANGQKIPIIQQKNKQQQQQDQLVNNNHKTQTQNDDPYSSSIDLSSENYNDVTLHQSNQPTSIQRFSHNHNKTKQKRTIREVKSGNIMEHPHDDSSEAFQTLVQQFQHIKSNSYFDQCWKQNI